MAFHLLHPAVVHFSVAFILVGAVCEIAAWATGRDGLARWSGGLVLIGLATLVPTVATGYLAGNTVDPTPEGMRVLETHERNAWFLLAVLFASQFLKAWCRGELSGWARIVYVLLLAGVVALTVNSAWLGGQMVYGHGVGVL